MGYRLTWEEDKYVYRIGWVSTNDGVMDSTVGENKTLHLQQPPKDREAWAAYDLKPNRDHRGFYWESQSDVQAALRVIKQALKQERPLPEWAKMALAAGWKPPKGWKA